MICPYASELGDDEGIPSGVFVEARYRKVKRATSCNSNPAPRCRARIPGYEIRSRLSPKLKALAAAIAERNNVVMTDMLSPTQVLAAANGRYEMWAEMSATMGMSHREIGMLFGRERSTVRRGIDVWLNRQPRKAVAA